MTLLLGVCNECNSSPKIHDRQQHYISSSLVMEKFEKERSSVSRSATHCFQTKLQTGMLRSINVNNHSPHWLQFLTSANLLPACHDQPTARLKLYFVTGVHDCTTGEVTVNILHHVTYVLLRKAAHSS